MPARLRFAFSTLICVFPVFVTAPSFAGVVNGDFEDSTALNGWESDQSVEIRSDSDGNYAFLPGVAFSNSPSFYLFQQFTLPSDAVSLSFDFAFFDNGTPVTPVQDSFEATLFDQSGLSDGISSISPVEIFPGYSLPPYFVEGGGSTQLGNGVNQVTNASGLRTGWSRVTLDLRGVAPQQVGIDFFLLNNSMSLPEADALVDNVVLRTSPGNVIPEPASAATWGLAMLSTFAIGLRRKRAP